MISRGRLTRAALCLFLSRNSVFVHPHQSETRKRRRACPSVKGFKQPANAATATCQSCGPGRCGLAEHVLRALAVNPTIKCKLILSMISHPGRCWPEVATGTQPPVAIEYNSKLPVLRSGLNRLPWNHLPPRDRRRSLQAAPTRPRGQGGALPHQQRVERPANDHEGMRGMGVHQGVLQANARS